MSDPFLVVQKGPIHGAEPPAYLATLVDVAPEAWDARVGADARVDTLTIGDRTIRRATLRVPRYLGLTAVARDRLCHELAHIVAGVQAGEDTTHESDGGCEAPVLARPEPSWTAWDRPERW